MFHSILHPKNWREPAEVAARSKHTYDHHIIVIIAITVITIIIIVIIVTSHRRVSTVGVFSGYYPIGVYFDAAEVWKPGLVLRVDMKWENDDDARTLISAEANRKNNAAPGDDDCYYHLGKTAADERTTVINGRIYTSYITRVVRFRRFAWVWRCAPAVSFLLAFPAALLGVN